MHRLNGVSNRYFIEFSRRRELYENEIDEKETLLKGKTRQLQIELLKKTRIWESLLQQAGQNPRQLMSYQSGRSYDVYRQLKEEAMGEEL